jgi:superfamily II DNA or RNA helicase
VYGRTLPWVEDRQCVLVDETHGLKAKAIRGILESCKQGIYRLGLTGTLPDSPSDLNLIMGLTGPVLDEEKTDVLIDKGILSGIQVNVCAITYSKEQKKMLRELTNEFGATQTSYQLERRFLEENPMRNALIAKTAGTLMKEGKNVLILVEKLAHGEKLKEVVLSETGIEPEFIQGSMDVDDREDIRKGLEDHGGSVTIGTYGCVSLGINVRRLHAIVFAASGKSKIRVLQSIGRALRTHKDKVLAQIYDFNDNLQYGKAHAKARINFYVKNDFPMCASEVTIA